jgi:hypothetical protein
MLETILILLAAAVIAVLIIAAMQPAEFRVSRNAIMAASPASIFGNVNDLHLWEAWSPWAKLDPKSKSTFEGVSSGVGAVMRWQGNHKVGMGSMTIVESKPSENIKLKLEFLKPMTATNLAEFSFKSEGKDTLVTWSMTGTNNFMGKVMSVVMNCDKMVGGQFEKGLSSLKAIVEAG